MISVSVSLDIDKAREAFLFHQREVTLAANRAINRVADSARAEGVRAIHGATQLKTADVRKRMTVHGSNPETLTATITGLPFSPNLARFGARQTRAGVTADAWEGRKLYRHSFIMPRTGQVVARVGRARFPLKGLRGPSVPRTFITPDVLRAMLVKVYERFPIEFARELARRLS